MGTIVSGKVDAAARLLGAEAEYLRVCGWIPSTRRITKGVLWYKLNAEEILRSQEEALELQKAADNWPNVRE